MLKKGGGGLTRELERTQDILAGLGPRKGGRLLVGFAAETEDLVSRARGKLEAKNLDLIVANHVAAGFGGETNEAVLVGPKGEAIEVPRVSKRELADRICDEIVQRRLASATPAPSRPTAEKVPE
jgi:phosphopantothenoylcysteine decarboxylase/phosphopantothenate--cysteine ligase